MVRLIIFFYRGGNSGINKLITLFKVTAMKDTLGQVSSPIELLFQLGSWILYNNKADKYLIAAIMSAM